MPKFPKLKGRQIAQEAGKMGAVVLGTVGTAKFLNFDEIFKNQPEDSFMRKNQGPIKLGLAILLMPMIKNDYLKMALLGMGVEGGIRTVRQFSVNKETNQSFFPQVGRGAQNNDYYWQEYKRMMGQFPGYGYTPNQVKEQLTTSVGNVPPGGTSPMTEIPFAVSGQF